VLGSTIAGRRPLGVALLSHTPLTEPVPRDPARVLARAEGLAAKATGMGLLDGNGVGPIG